MSAKEMNDNARATIKKCALTAKNLDIWLKEHEGTLEHIKMMTAFEIGNYELFRKHERKHEEHRWRCSYIIKILKPEISQPRHYWTKLITALTDPNAPESTAEIKDWAKAKRDSYKKHLAGLGLLKIRAEQFFEGIIEAQPIQPPPEPTKEMIAEGMMPPEMEGDGDASSSEEEGDDSSSEGESDSSSEEEAEEKAEEKAPAQPDWLPYKSYEWRVTGKHWTIRKQGEDSITFEGNSINPTKAIAKAKAEIDTREGWSWKHKKKEDKKILAEATKGLF